MGMVYDDNSLSRNQGGSQILWRKLQRNPYFVTWKIYFLMLLFTISYLWYILNVFESMSEKKFQGSLEEK